MIIHEIKLDRNIFRVNQIQNHSHHKNIHISTHRIVSVIEKPIANTVIFAVLVITHTSSSLLFHSQLGKFSIYHANFHDMIFDRKNVATITINAKIKFNSTSVLKKLDIILTFSFDLSNSFCHTAAYVFIVLNAYNNTEIIDIFLFFFICFKFLLNILI
ncbi:hypothetical protein HOG21_05920 [bacterium]|jgi:hypothetical protein|nr:hypothetical protein [bacterium]